MPTDYPTDDPLPSVTPELAGLTGANAYVTSIPEDAKPKITQTWGDRSPKRIEYYVGKELVGTRSFDRNGNPEQETAYREGKLHGDRYRWYGDGGCLQSKESFENGLEHGTTLQFDRDGRLIGANTYVDGTGWDLWYQPWDDGSIDLSEARSIVGGLWHGYEWWLRRGKLTSERHWRDGHRHGVEWRWDGGDAVRDGYPKFWIDDAEVDELAYARAALTDSALPPYRTEDNRTEREFPPEITRVLRMQRRL